MQWSWLLLKAARGEATPLNSTDLNWENRERVGCRQRYGVVVGGEFHSSDGLSEGAGRGWACVERCAERVAGLGDRRGKQGHGDRSRKRFQHIVERGAQQEIKASTRKTSPNTWLFKNIVTFFLNPGFCEFISTKQHGMCLVWNTWKNKHKVFLFSFLTNSFMEALHVPKLPTQPWNSLEDFLDVDVLEWIVPGMAKREDILTMCWCHHDHGCMEASQTRCLMASSIFNNIKPAQNYWQAVCFQKTIIYTQSQV